MVHRLSKLMMRTAWLVLPVALMTFAVHSPVSGQTGTEIGIDFDISGNTATELGTVEDCVSLETGETTEIDVFIRDVTDLLAWEGHLIFDSDVIEITDADVDLFMGANEGSEVQSVVSALPDSDGLLPVGAFDASDPPAPDTGSGVLARVTVRAVGAGSTELAFRADDVDGDTTLDSGVLLRDADDEFIGDEDGDSFFDGTVSSGLVAVGISCEDAIAGETPPAENGGGGGDDDDGPSTWLIVTVIAGVAAVILAGGGAFLAFGRRSSR